MSAESQIVTVFLVRVDSMGVCEGVIDEGGMVGGGTAFRVGGSSFRSVPYSVSHLSLPLLALAGLVAKSAGDCRGLPVRGMLPRVLLGVTSLSSSGVTL